MGSWSEVDWSWQIDTSMEEVNMEVANEKREFLEILREVFPKLGVKDSVAWSLGGTGEYNVKSFYSELLEENETIMEEDNN